VVSAPIIVNSPLSSSDQVGHLLQAGADSFYAGIIPRGASELAHAYVSRRHYNKHNLSAEDFARAQEKVHQAGKQLFITVNEHFYSPDLLQLIFEELDELTRKPGLTGVIVAEISLIQVVRERYPGLDIVASTGMSVFNSEAVKLLSSLGVSRVVLPRAISLEETARLARSCPDIELECFILFERCPNIDGFCSYVHCEMTDRHFKSQCLDVKLEELIDLSQPGAGTSPESAARFDEALGFEASACGACFMRAFYEAGVRCFKIVGRGYPAAKILRGTRLISGLRDMVQGEEPSADQLRDAAMALRKKIFKTECSSGTCYYPWSPGGGRDHRGAG
jgi:U32 family peptidase